MYNNNESYNNWTPWGDEPKPEPPKKKQRNGIRGAGVVAIALVCALLGGIAGAGVVYFADELDDRDSKPTHSSAAVHSAQSRNSLSEKETPPSFTVAFIVPPFFVPILHRCTCMLPTRITCACFSPIESLHSLQRMENGIKKERVYPDLLL